MKMKRTCVEGAIPKLFEGKMLVRDSYIQPTWNSVCFMSHALYTNVFCKVENCSRQVCFHCGLFKQQAYGLALSGLRQIASVS